MTARPEVGRTLRAAWRHDRSTPRELRTRQDQALRDLVRHSYEHVPYYRRLFDRHRLHPRHIRGVRDLELIPPTTGRDLLRARPSDLVAAGYDPTTLLGVRAGESSGEPYTIRRSWMEDKLQLLLRLRALGSLGLRHRDRIAAVGLVGPLAGFPRTVVFDGLLEPGALAGRLAAFAPDVLTGRPGLLDRLADPALASLVGRVRPRLVIVGGDVATPAVRHRLRAAFGAPVCEVYGSHECPLIAWECRRGGDLHVCDDGIALELLRDGRPALPGERGEVVVTNLYAYAMPLLRFRLGDLAVAGGPCICGAPFSTLAEVQGRIGPEPGDTWWGSPSGGTAG